MTTYMGKSCSFCLPRVPFVNCRQFMYLVISLLVLRAGYGIWLYQFLIIAYLFTLFLSVRHRLIRYAHLWNFIKLSCTVQKSWWFSVKSYGDFHELIRSLRSVPIELCYNAVWRYRFLNTLWPLYTSSIGIYLQSENQLVESEITFELYTR